MRMLRYEAKSRKEISSLKDVKIPSTILENVFDNISDPVKDNIIIVIQKHTTSATDRYHYLPY